MKASLPDPRPAPLRIAATMPTKRPFVSNTGPPGEAQSYARHARNDARPEGREVADARTYRAGYGARPPAGTRVDAYRHEDRAAPHQRSDG
jgi:hypothetical protein